MKNTIRRIGYQTAKLLNHTKKLTFPLILASIITGCVLMFGGVLSPVALGILGNTLLAIMIGAAASIAASWIGRLFYYKGAQLFGSADNYEDKYDSEYTRWWLAAVTANDPQQRQQYMQRLNTLQRPYALFPPLRELAITYLMIAAFVTLTVLGVWAPVVMSTTGAVFAILGASLCLGAIFHATVNLLVKSIITLLPKPQIITANQPSTASPISAPTPSPKASVAQLNKTSSATILNNLPVQKANDSQDDDDLAPPPYDPNDNNPLDSNAYGDGFTFTVPEQTILKIDPTNPPSDPSAVTLTGTP